MGTMSETALYGKVCSFMILKWLRSVSKNFDCDKLIKKLKEILKNGDDPNAYLSQFILNGGVESATYSDGLKPHLDSVGARWIDVAEKYLNDSELLRSIDFEIIDRINIVSARMKEKKRKLQRDTVTNIIDILYFPNVVVRLLEP